MKHRTRSTKIGAVGSILEIDDAWPTVYIRGHWSEAEALAILWSDYSGYPIRRLFHKWGRCSQHGYFTGPDGEYRWCLAEHGEPGRGRFPITVVDLDDR